jgi:hypothetical protein
MELRFCIQDPTHPETTYLYEAIIAAAVDAAAWRAVYAFASRDGVDHLIEDPVVHDFMRSGGEMDLLVGIDAVTNRPTLERLRDLEHRNRRFHPKIFWNGTHGLFHPKLSDFTYEGGRRTLIVGSGNLTPGGLMNNFEGYTVISVDQAEELDVSALDEFLARHAEHIRSIDDEALERAARNLVRPIKGARQAGGLVIPRSAQAEPIPAAAFNRILIAQVPKAGGRWAQVHFNTDVVREYFRIADYKTQRVYLTHVTPDGARAEVEVRPCVYSQANKNHKIEIGAARGQEYPNDASPVLVLRERQLRVFDYMLLMPGEPGYASLVDLTRKLPSLGKGFRRVITNMETLAASWPDCPLLTSEDADEQEI